MKGCPSSPLLLLGTVLALPGQAVLAEDSPFSVGLDVTVVGQVGTAVVEPQDHLITGSYSLSLGFDLPESELGRGSLGLLVEGGANLTHRTSEDLAANLGVRAAGNDDYDTEPIVVTEAWYSHHVAEDRFVVSVGKIDLTAWMDGNRLANDETTQFLAPVFVNNPAIAFPENGLGVVAALRLHEAWTLTLGVADAAADARETGFNTVGSDWFHAAELAGTIERSHVDGVALISAVRLIVWHASVGDERGGGAAVSFDHACVAGLILFGRAGVADRAVSEFAASVSLGLGWEEPFDRPDDLVAVGWAWSDPSESGDRSEQVIELFYRCQLTDHLAVSPGVQVVLDPTDHADEDVLAIFNLRLNASF